MADIALLDRAFHNIMRRFIKTGQAPRHTELAKDLGLTMEEGRQLFHDVMKAYRAGSTRRRTGSPLSRPSTISPPSTA